MSKSMALILMFATLPVAASAAPRMGGSMLAQNGSKLEQRFNQADTNHDGKLTMDEAKAGMPRVAKHFDDMDTEHRGYVTLDQIKTYATNKKAGSSQ